MSHRHGSTPGNPQRAWGQWWHTIIAPAVTAPDTGIDLYRRLIHPIPCWLREFTCRIIFCFVLFAFSRRPCCIPGNIPLPLQVWPCHAFLYYFCIKLVLHVLKIIIVLQKCCCARRRLVAVVLPAPLGHQYVRLNAHCFSFPRIWYFKRDQPYGNTFLLGAFSRKIDGLRRARVPLTKYISG